MGGNFPLIVSHTEKKLLFCSSKNYFILRRTFSGLVRVERSFETMNAGIPGSSPSPMSISAPTPPPSNMAMNNGPMSNVAMKRLVGVGDNNEVLDKKRLQELVKEVDPNEQLDEEVENMLLQIADDFIEQVSLFKIDLK